jgi:hypothetical protein
MVTAGGEGDQTTDVKKAVISPQFWDGAGEM